MPKKLKKSYGQTSNRGLKEKAKSEAQGMDDGTPMLALKYYDPDYECFSTWEAEELKGFSDLCQRLPQYTWEALFRTGGKPGNKTGPGYTKHHGRGHLPVSPVLKRISEDVDFYEMRVTQKARIHGFRSGSAFYLVWLDRNHNICS